MNGWQVIYLPEAEEELIKLDNPQKAPVLKAITKVRANPLPLSEGGLGKPLGNHKDSKLTKCCKIVLKNLGLRVVYFPSKDRHIMQIIAISTREDSIVYKIAHDRLDNLP